MTQYSLSPAFVKMTYTYSTRLHVATLPCRIVGTPEVGTEPDLYYNDDTTDPFEDVMVYYANAIKPFINENESITVASVWSQPTPDDDPVWVYETTLGIDGTNVTAVTPHMQRLFTWRTSLGHLMKTVIMDVPGTVNVRGVPPYSGINATFATFFLSGANFVRGRDGGKPVAAIKYYTKTNDALRRKYIVDE
jgi:hypothetical protein